MNRNLFIVFALAIMALQACKEKDNCEGVSDRTGNFPILSDFRTWVPLSLHDTVNYIDSVGNTLQFVVASCDTFVTETSFDDLTTECIVHVHYTYDNIKMELESQQIPCKITYTLFGSDEGNCFALFAPLSLTDSCTSLYGKTARILDNSFVTTSYIAYYDSISVINKMFYSVYVFGGSNETSKIYYTRSEGVVGFKNYDSANHLFYRLN